MTGPNSLERRLHETTRPDDDASRAAGAGAALRYTMAVLLADAEVSGAYPLPPEEREWVDAPAVGRELLPEDLQTSDAIAAFITHAESTADPDYIAHARKIAAQAKIMHTVE